MGAKAFEEVCIFVGAKEDEKEERAEAEGPDIGRTKAEVDVEEAEGIKVFEKELPIVELKEREFPGESTKERANGFEELLFIANWA